MTIRFNSITKKGQMSIYLGNKKTVSEVNQVIIDNYYLRDLHPSGIFYVDNKPY